MMEKVRAQVSLLAMAIIATAAAASFRTAAGASYTVGEPGGSWDLRTNLTAWASTITFHPDDQLVFKYDAAAHDVVEVTRAGYRSCSAARPVSGALRTGSDAVRLDGGVTRRRRYFICSTPGHCAAGMKLEVRVVKDDDAECTNRLPPPGPAPPGAPSGIFTICSGGPPVVISSPGVVAYGAAPRSSSAGLGSVVATVVMVIVSLLLGLALV